MVKLFKKIIATIRAFFVKKQEKQTVKKAVRKLTPIVVKKVTTKKKVFRFLFRKNRIKRLSHHECLQLVHRKFGDDITSAKLKFNITQQYQVKWSNA